MIPIEEYFASLPPRLCVHCGYCCKQAPCIHGEGIPCTSLTKDNKCALYIGIKTVENIYQVPEEQRMFDNECCSTLNTDRLNIIGNNPTN